MSGSKSKCIEVIMRARPTKKTSSCITLENEENKCIFDFSKDPSKGYVNNTETHYEFKFDKLLDQTTKQEPVFEAVAKEVIESCMSGYNGTIFAYGQTGSGKTFTITGGTERYVDRGLIPRTISYIFSEAQKRTHSSYRINISYLEIYNDVGYDLLNADHQSKSLYDLPKVILQENSNEEFVIKNLSIHRAETEEDALNLLFMGDTNRVISETPKNDASTRSHCIFIIQIEAQKYGEDVKTISKLHLVDLSGSERIWKTGIEGDRLKEAKYINLSLHYLEQVIVCLNKRSKGEDVFVPYRNSLMTKVLRDSLGGNCKTKMIANISPDPDDILETLSTCKFAMRVAKVKNEVLKNEVTDPALIIQRLKKEIAELKAEIALLKGENTKDHLEPEDIDKCNKIVEEFIENKDPGANIILSDKLLINQCFYRFKHLYNELRKKGGSYESKQESQSNEMIPNSAYGEEIERLNALIKQRDNEILILVNVMNKTKITSEAVPQYVKLEPNLENKFNPNQIIEEQKETKDKIKTEPLEFSNSHIKDRDLNIQENQKMNLIQTGLHDKKPNSPYKNSIVRKSPDINQVLNNPIDITAEDLLDRTKTFEMFRKSYRRNEAMEENKNLLKDKYVEGKQLGIQVSETRNQLKVLTNRIEMIRKDNALKGNLDENNNILKTPEEEELQKQISFLKEKYHKEYSQLKDLKSEIERIQTVIERSREKMQKDFEQWLELMMKQVQKSPSKSTSISGTNASLQQPAKDPKVNENLVAFYKARDEIYYQAQKNINI